MKESDNEYMFCLPFKEMDVSGCRISVWNVDFFGEAAACLSIVSFSRHFK